MRTVSELEQEIRDLINSPRRHFQLSRNKAAFNKVCSSLDVLGDTEVAFSAYLEGEEHISSGEGYLIVYGVLQALFLQQYAVRHLHQALGFKYEEDPLLRSIREVRNKASGHPTEKGRGKETTFHHISRISMTRYSFTLVTTDVEGNISLKNIEVPQLIEAQRGILRRVLTEVINKIKEEEMEHRKKFRNEKLVDTFPKSIDHTYEKIAETIGGGLSFRVGATLVGSIIEAVAAFKSALDARGVLEAYDYSVGHMLRELEYPLNELHSYFSDPQGSKLNSQDASIFLFFITQKIAELIEVAREIDEEYATDFPD